MGQKADRNPYRKPGDGGGSFHQERQYRQELQRLITGLGQNAVFRRLTGYFIETREAKRGLYLYFKKSARSDLHRVVKAPEVGVSRG